MLKHQLVDTKIRVVMSNLNSSSDESQWVYDIICHDAVEASHLDDVSQTGLSLKGTQTQTRPLTWLPTNTQLPAYYTSSQQGRDSAIWNSMYTVTSL